MSDELVFFLHVDQIYEVEMYKDILQAQGIPVIVRSKGSGAYLQVYMGVSWTGFDLYVPASQLDKARQVELQPLPETDLPEEDDSPEE